MPNIMQRGSRRNWAEIEHPRGNFHWGDLSQEHRDVAESAMEGLSSSGAIERTITGRAEEYRGRIAAGERLPAKAADSAEVVERGMAHLGSIGGTGMDASVRSIKDAAMLPIRAERKRAKETGEIRSPLSGGYYPARHNVGRIVGEHTFGKGSEGAFATMMASPILSARTPPQIEVSGGAGLAATMRGAEDIGIDIGPVSARYLNERLRGSKGRQPIQEGRTNLAHLSHQHAAVAALLLQHGATQSGLVVPSEHDETKLSASKRDRDSSLRADARIHIPSDVEGPVAAFVRSGGVSGFPKLGAAIQRFNDPTNFGTSPFHKLGSYGWNIHSAGHPDVQQGVHHFLGALTHGDEWFRQNPSAEGHIRKAMKHEAWHDPTSTQDVWAARLATGLHPHVAQALGEAVNPENIMAFAGVSGMKRTQRGYGTREDMGYLFGEEATRRASQQMSVRLPSGGRAHAPASTAQSLGWFGVQAQANPEMVKSGQRTLTPDTPHDPRGLNPLRLPEMW